MGCRVYSQHAPKSQLREFKLMKSTVFWLCNCRACVVQLLGHVVISPTNQGVLWVPVDVSGPFPRAWFQPLQETLKLLRWSSIEEIGESLDFITPAGGRQVNCDYVGRWDICYSCTNSLPTARERMPLVSCLCLNKDGLLFCYKQL